MTTRHSPSPSQQSAIEAEAGPLLVLAGPGAGKTFCLIERIRFLIEERQIEPARICAFTFTNKAAGEIGSRLKELGPRAERVRRGTIHAFCARLLRELGSHVGLESGFGIADEAYQLTVLARIEGRRPWHGKVLSAFSAHRFCNEPLQLNDRILFDEYQGFLTSRNLVDFDMLVLKTAELMASTPAADEVRARWDVILVDEFQDLNPVEYRIIRELSREHRHVFAVGDDEQSIFSWKGADRTVFKSFWNDFSMTRRSTVRLAENHRCPRGIFAMARSLLGHNEPLFPNHVAPEASRDSAFPVTARGFTNEQDEVAWIVEDIRRDQIEHGHAWGEVAVLYRKHFIGEDIETALVNAGVPSRLAQGRALADDPVIGYVVAALRVIAAPGDDVHRDNFFAIVLPKPLLDEARAQAETNKHDLRQELNYMLARKPRGDEGRRQIRRALFAWRNLDAIGRQHDTLPALVQELVTQRIRNVRSVLDQRHDELSDPATNPEVVELAARLRTARAKNRSVWLASLGGVEIPLKGMLASIGFTHVQLGGEPPDDSVCLDIEDVPSLGLPLGLFKAAQLIEIGDDVTSSRSFTTIDLETTDSDARTAEIVDIAAVRVRDGRIQEEYSSYVKPSMPIPAAATDIHGIRDNDVATAPTAQEVWPDFRAFCGRDVIVAHNGYEFDFLILKRVARSCGIMFDLCTYDTLPLARELYPTSRRLGDLAHQFGIDTGRSHRALYDARTLAQLFIRLDRAKLERARKTALLDLLDQLGLALALVAETSLSPEARLFRDIARPHTLGRYTTCLESYERERGDDDSILTLAEVIERLGGVKAIERMRSEKSPEERYPGAMLRLRRLIEEIPEGPREAQVAEFLERAVLSKWDGTEKDSKRVNLLTLHSTKGLEFSRVYIVGVEDAELPGAHPVHGTTVAEIEEGRRLLYVGMTRAKDRLVLTRVESRRGRLTGGHRFLDEMTLYPHTRKELENP